MKAKLTTGSTQMGTHKGFIVNLSTENSKRQLDKTALTMQNKNADDIPVEVYKLVFRQRFLPLKSEVKSENIFGSLTNRIALTALAYLMVAFLISAFSSALPGFSPHWGSGVDFLGAFPSCELISAAHRLLGSNKDGLGLY